MLAITGSSSPIGSSVIQELTKLPSIQTIKIGRTTSTETVDVEGDITSPLTASSLLNKIQPEVVLHLSHAPLDTFDGDVETYKARNKEFAKRLANNSLENGCKRFIFGSSSAVYGDQFLGTISEFSPLNPSSPYGELKAEIELELKQIFDGSDARLTSARMFNVFGPGLTKSMVHKLTTFSSGDEVKLFGPENFIRDYIHVHDVAQIFIELILGNRDTSNELNLGTGVAISNSKILEMLPTKISQEIEVTPHESSSSVADVGLLRQFIGKLEFISLEKWFESTLELNKFLKP